MADTQKRCKNCFDPIPVDYAKHSDFCRMCYLDLFKPDGRLNECQNCKQWKEEYEDFLCKECWKLENEPELDFGDYYAFNKDI